MIVAIHQPQYLPWLAYVSKADSGDVFVYLDNVQFQKNGVQNRNQIKAADGAMWLTVPVHAHLHRSIAETEIAGNQWMEKHLRAIALNYAKAEHFKRYRNELETLLRREWKSLAELNIAVTEWLFTAMEISCKRVRASELKVEGKGEELILNMCQKLGAKTYLSGQGAKAYQDPQKFRERGIELRYQSYEPVAYRQCHMKRGFISGLSALDAILNIGDAARELINRTEKSRVGRGA